MDEKQIQKSVGQHEKSVFNVERRAAITTDFICTLGIEVLEMI